MNTKQCKCGTAIAPIASGKDNENKGRLFFRCGKCMFFQWGPPLAAPLVLKQRAAVGSPIVPDGRSLLLYTDGSCKGSECYYPFVLY